ncbi:MAG: PKD domain-containing protein [Fidelibacterota bacterium]
MKKNFLWILWIVSLLFMVQSCSLFEDLLGISEDNDDEKEVAIETEDKSGILIITDDANVDVKDFQVITLTNIDDLGENGEFEVKGNISDKIQILIFKKQSKNLPVYIGLFDPVTKKVTANDTTTALALTLLNPYLVYTTQTQRQQYIEAVRYHENFDDLLALLNQAYASDADNALNYEVNPRIYQTAVVIMKGVMEQLGGMAKAMGVQELEPPSIQDVTGTKVNFVNPRRIYYAAGINENGNLKDVVTLEKSAPITSFNWGWPPTFHSSSTESEYDLGNGTFDINIIKGIDFTKISDWEDPVGRATLLNSAQAIIYFMDLFTGYNLIMDTEDLNISISNDLAQLMTRYVNENNTEDFIKEFCRVMKDNSDDISTWLLDAESEAAEEYIETCALVLENAVFVFKLMGFVNENGPFYWELINSPTEVMYRVTQANGTITEKQENNPPEAEFTVDPPAGIVTTQFNFDASQSVDEIDGQTGLMYRWDFNSDGTWEADWSSSPTITIEYTEAGSYLVTLQVKDSAGLIGTITHRVNVGGGAGTATHVKLFQDALPWSSNAMITMLESLGFTEGGGANQYEIIPSTDMATVSLIPGTDLVIIANDQNDTFYANYAASQVRFNNFVYTGGSLFWEACDRGWAYGNMVDQGVVLPGNITQNHNYDNYNYVTDQNLPLVSGLPDELDHNYASHESFTNLQDGTTIYCVDSYSQPTLVEYNLGGGWVIVTGQPLEHQYDNNYGVADDMSQLLPRIVSYFTGKAFGKQLPKPLSKSNGRPSSAE